MQLAVGRPLRRRRGGAFALLAVALSTCLGACRSRTAPSTALLLVTVDTLRADHLGAYGYPRPTSPVIDRLAAEGFLFERAWAQWPKTGPSFASLLSSTYPKDNGLVRRVGVPVPAGMRLLAEELRRAGYGTHAVVANGALASELGYGQGFDSYVETWKLPGYADPHAATRAEVTTERALALADGLERGRPFFLWVHYLDPHFPYAPPAPWSARFVGDAWYAPQRQVMVAATSAREMGGIGRAEVLDGHREHAFYVARYDAEIAYTDAMVGELLSGLERRGLLADAVLALTADHGESLGEHDYYFHHGRFAFETCLHVPLLLWGPGRVEPGRNGAPAQLIDLAPTLLELAGVPLDGGAWMQGRSLLPRLRGRPGESHYAYAEAGYATDGRWQKAITDGRYKLIYASHAHDQRFLGGRGQPFLLYDLAEDPGELRDLAREREGDRARLEQALFAWWQPDSFPVLVDEEEGEAPGLSLETRQQLQALGYLQ